MQMSANYRGGVWAGLESETGLFCDIFFAEFLFNFLGY